VVQKVANKPGSSVVIGSKKDSSAGGSLNDPPSLPLGSAIPFPDDPKM